jgi:hypothetical protein
MSQIGIRHLQAECKTYYPPRVLAIPFQAEKHERAILGLVSTEDGRTDQSFPGRADPEVIANRGPPRGTSLCTAGRSRDPLEPGNSNARLYPHSLARSSAFALSRVGRSPMH